MPVAGPRVAHLEHLDREHAGDAELAGDPQRRPRWPRRRASGSRPGAGASTSVQMPSVCTVSTTGHAAACPERAARDQHRELADEVDPLLGEQALGERPSPAAACRASRPVLGRRPRATAHALAVVAAARGLDHDRPADLVAEGLHVRRVRAPRPSAGTGRRARRAARAWPACPGRRPGRPGVGCSATPSASSAASTSAGTCSWSKVTTSQSRANARTASRSVGCADRRGRDHQRGGRVGRLGEHAQLDAELDGRARHHAGQLAAADDADHGESAGGTLRRVTRRSATGGPGAPLDSPSGLPLRLWPAEPLTLPRPRPTAPMDVALPRDAQVRRRRRGRLRHRLRRVQPAGLRLAEGTPARQPLRPRSSR